MVLLKCKNIFKLTFSIIISNININRSNIVYNNVSTITKSIHLHAYVLTDRHQAVSLQTQLIQVKIFHCLSCLARSSFFSSAMTPPAHPEVV